KVVEEYLAPHQISLQHFSSSKEALRYVKNAAPEKLPDLFLLDYLMPEMDGITLAREIQKLPECANIPFLMLTSFEERGSLHTFAEAGFRAYLVKPVFEKPLIEAISRVLTMPEGEAPFTYRSAVESAPEKALPAPEAMDLLSSESISERSPQI